MRVFFPFLLWDYESYPPILWESCKLFRKTGTWKTAVAVNFHPPSLPPPPNLQLPSKSGRTSCIFPGSHFHGSHVFVVFFPLGCRFGGGFFEANDYGHTDRWELGLLR